MQNNLELLRQVQERGGLQDPPGPEGLLHVCLLSPHQPVPGRLHRQRPAMRPGWARRNFPGRSTCSPPPTAPTSSRSCSDTADHFVFNSPSPGATSTPPRARAAGKQVGLRVNPECSTQEGHAIYDPCAPGSRLGTTLANFRPRACCPCWTGCTSTPSASRTPTTLETTLAAFEDRFGPYLHRA